MRYPTSRRSVILAAVLASGISASAQYQQPPYPQPPQQPMQYPQAAQTPSQYGQQPAQQPLMSADDLDTLLAPIALYPDSLLSQVLMASTYPLEVVQAQRFVTSNPNLSGDAMADALAQQNWDPSVKSLTNFPSVLQMLNDKLDWTVQLGNAFLAQQKDVMDSVQRLRQQAQAAGNLQTNQYQHVEELPAEVPQTEPQYIVIQNAQPDDYYVPVYDPFVIYGTWHYRERPWFWHPSNYQPTHGIWWGDRYHEGPAWGYAWGRPDWQKHDVDIDINRHKKIDIHVNRQDVVRDEHWNVVNGRGEWQHDPAHRSGVAYGDPNTAQRYGGRAPENDVRAREQYRGRDDTPVRVDTNKHTDDRHDEPVDRNTARDVKRDDTHDVNRNNVRDSDTHHDTALHPAPPAAVEPAPQRREETEQRHSADAAPAPERHVPSPAPAAPSPEPAPARHSESEHATSPRAEPPAGSGVRGDGGDARADSARGRESRAEPAPSAAPSAPSGGGGSSGGKGGSARH